MRLYPLKIAPDICIRKEYFGGLIYDPRNGNIIEIDKQAFLMLDLIKNKTVDPDDLFSFLEKNDISKALHTRAVVEKLVDLNILVKNDNPPSSLHLPPNQVPVSRQYNWLSAPETVHWAVTYRCDKNCPDCYVQRFNWHDKELDTRNALKLIDKIADWGVFQLAIGGGEPFDRKDLSELVHHAADRGLTVHVTTGKLDLDYNRLNDLAQSLNVLQIGIPAQNILSRDASDTINQIHHLHDAAKACGLLPGASVILSQSNIQRLGDIVKNLESIGFRRIIFLRYKPPASLARWQEERPSYEQLESLHLTLNSIVKTHPYLNIRVDCALSFVQRHLATEKAEQWGIKGCVAADRIMAISPDGSAYPCSQLVHPTFWSGNLMQADPELIWEKTKPFRKVRSFRTKKSFKYSWCGVCLKNNSCGGCRVFADDGLGGDPDCPEPVKPPLNNLGKKGRKVDLEDYLNRYQSITIGGYMERYGVGQRTAIKELNHSKSTLSDTQKPARKRTDGFFNRRTREIMDIQDTIGYTSGGYPFVSQAEIEEGLKEPDYPNWIDNVYTPFSGQIPIIKSTQKKKKKKKKRKKQRKKKR